MMLRAILTAAVALSSFLAACSTSGDSDPTSTILAAADATGVVFDLSAPCQQDGDNWKNCGGARSKTFATQGVSATSNATIRGLPFENYILTTFYCRTLTPANAQWTHGPASGTLGAGPTSKLEEPVNVPYAGAEIKITFTPGGNIFKTGCKLELAENITYPPVEAIGVYAKGLRKLQKKLASVYEDVTPNGDSAEAIDAMDEGVDTLDLVAESQRSPITKQKVLDAKTRLSNARTRVSHDCGGGAQLCTQALAAARSTINSDVTLYGTEINQVKAFVDAEATRLRAVSGAVSAKIDALTSASSCLDVTKPINQVCQ